MNKLVFGSYFVGSTVAIITLSSGFTMLARLAPIVRNQLILIMVILVTISSLFCLFSPNRQSLGKVALIVIGLVGLGVILGCN
jgi:uncharacterized RDD family membrane protein YckC